MPPQSAAAALELPAYEPPYLPLSHAQILNIAPLSSKTQDLKQLLDAAMVSLREAAGDLAERTPLARGVAGAPDDEEGDDDSDNNDNNDNDPEEEARKKRRRRKSQKPQNAITAHQKLLEEMDSAAKGLIDGGVVVADIKQTLTRISTHETHAEFALRAREQRAEMQQLQEEEEEDEEERGGGRKVVGVEEGLWGRYKAGFKEAEERYATMGEREKYGNAGDYVQYRRIIWEANHPTSPMPHVRNWFPAARPQTPPTPSHPSRRVAAAAPADSDSDLDNSDLEIAQERQSYKCPLTLKPYEHPVTSTLCPHSFEKAAITEMINTARPRGVGVACPMPGCGKRLTLDVLKPDPVLERRVRRAARLLEAEREKAMEEEERREVEGGEEGEEEGDVEMQVERDVSVKKEKGRRRIGRGRGRGRVFEIGSGSDE